MIYALCGLSLSLAAFAVWRARKRVHDWDDHNEWRNTWEDVIDAPVIQGKLEEERINKEFEKLRKQLERRYAKGRRQK